MLRKIRIVLASVFFIGVTLLFLDFTGTLHAWLGWMAKIQFLPTLLAANFVIVALLMVLTLVFGRVYCSVICPLGIMQDIISWARGKISKRDRFRFSYEKENKRIRYAILALFVILLLAGAHSIAMIIAPYSMYGRIAGNLLAPVYQAFNNIMAWMAERVGSYAFYSVDIWIRAVSTFITAIVSFVVLFLLAWRKGRTWCNTICPVGTVLGLFSRFSLLAPVIDSEKCRNCGLCSRRCKASCIDNDKHHIDHSRCIACMDCVDVCKDDAVHYAFRYSSRESRLKEESASEEDIGRRAFMTSALIAGTAIAAKAQEFRTDGGLSDVSRHRRPERKTPVVPAGSSGMKDFNSHCTACQLCVSTCPNGVLVPSADPETFMMPQMSFERGYCRPECTLCSQICPTGAIKPVSVAEKSSTKTGTAIVNLEICVVNTDEVSCGNCARHCPAGAIMMVRKDPDEENSLKIPSVDEERCIGCGACENLCPAKPLSAIHVEGIEVHREI